MKSMEIQVKVRKPSSAWGNAPFLLDLVSHLIDSEEEEGYNILRPITQVQQNQEGHGNEYKIIYFWEMHALDKCVSPPPFPPPLHGPVSLVFGKYPLTHLHWWRKALD